MDNDEIADKFQQLKTLYNAKLQERSEQHELDDEHLANLRDQITEWAEETKREIDDVVERKTRSLDEFYESYLNEIRTKYANLESALSGANRSIDLQEQMESFNEFIQKNQLKKRLILHPPTSLREDLHRKIRIEYIGYDELAEDPHIRPLQSTPKQPPESDRRRLTSDTHDDEPPRRRTEDPRENPTTTTVDRHHQSPTPERERASSRRDDGPWVERVAATTIRPSSPRIPVLVNREREVNNPREPLIEYSIDTVEFPQSVEYERSRKRSNSLNRSEYDGSNSDSLIKEYIEIHRRHHHHGRSNEEDDSVFIDERHGRVRDPDQFSFEQFSDGPFATIVLKQFASEFYCLASSTLRNELVLFNSELKMILILQHDEQQFCRQRTYIQWPRDENVGAEVSDIVYSTIHDQFLFTVAGSSRIYAFDRSLYSLRQVCQLDRDLSLRRFHCQQDHLYCILEHDYLVEYILDRNQLHLRFCRQISTFVVENQPRNIRRHLIDVACDDQYILIAYSDERDAIRLQLLDRYSLQFLDDQKIDEANPIKDKYIRIEAGTNVGNFIYLNGSKKHLKFLVIDNQQRIVLTSSSTQYYTPTNVAFLQNGRLVVLHERPHFLSIYPRREADESS